MFCKNDINQHIVFTYLFVYTWVAIIIKEKRAMNLREGGKHRQDGRR